MIQINKTDIGARASGSSFVVTRFTGNVLRRGCHYELSLVIKKIFRLGLWLGVINVCNHLKGFL